MGFCFQAHTIAMKTYPFRLRKVFAEQAKEFGDEISAHQAAVKQSAANIAQAVSIWEKRVEAVSNSLKATQASNTEVLSEISRNSAANPPRRRHHTDKRRKPKSARNLRSSRARASAAIHYSVCSPFLCSGLACRRRLAGFLAPLICGGLRRYRLLRFGQPKWRSSIRGRTEDSNVFKLNFARAY